MPFSAALTAMTGAIAGSLYDLADNVVSSFISEEASAEIPFGVMVARGTADNGALKLHTSSAAMDGILAGVVLHSNAYNKTNELGTTGLKPGIIMNVLRKGRVWVQVEEAVTPASVVKVRAVASGGEVAGAFRDTADSTDCVDISRMARYLTSAGAGELAVLELDLTGTVTLGVADT